MTLEGALDELERAAWTHFRGRVPASDALTVLPLRAAVKALVRGLAD